MDKEKEEQSLNELTPTHLTADDESITTSTESDAFGTWTLVTDKNKTKQAKEVKGAEENRIEILKSQKDASEESAEEEEQIEPKPEPNSSVDDLSDGISIISESESGGRISPHPYLRERLEVLDLKFSQGDGIDEILRRSQVATSPSQMSSTVSVSGGASGSNIRQRRKKRSSPVGLDKKSLQPVQSTVAKGQIHIIARRCLAGVFYVGVALALLAFIAKLCNPEWKSLSNEKPSSDLEQKIVDMELQNNLMRAEIDILSKQVNYLSALKDKGPFDESKRSASVPQYRDAKGEETVKHRKNTFKAWSGNGNSIDPVDITKDELKKPYKCPDGKFVELAGMCVENTPEEPIIDKIGNIVNYILHQSESVKTSEQMLEPEKEAPPELQPKTFSEASKSTTEEEFKLNNYNKQQQQWDANKQENRENRYRKEHRHSGEMFDGNSKEKLYPQSGKYERKRHEQQYKRQNKKHFNDNENESDENGNNDDDSSKESHKKRANKKNKSKKRPDKQSQSDERFDKDPHQSSGESKERFSKKRRKQQESGEHFDKKRNYRDHSGERFQKDGQWHEKMMQHREEARRQQEEQFEKNRDWFTERGSSRERMRFGENNYR